MSESSGTPLCPREPYVLHFSNRLTERVGHSYPNENSKALYAR